MEEGQMIDISLITVESHFQQDSHFQYPPRTKQRSV